MVAFDANGNTLTDAAGRTYTWDFENRLTKVVVPGAGAVSFKYDPMSRKILKSSGSGTTVYAYDGDNAVEETDGTGTVVARYSQGLGIDEPLAMFAGGASAYYQADGLGSVTSLTNVAGTLAETYAYDSFGKTSAVGSLFNPFQYSGRVADLETGLYYYRARYYDPRIGRFISEDPIRFRSGTNFYEYGDNGPISRSDPWGLQSWTKWICSDPKISNFMHSRSLELLRELARKLQMGDADLIAAVSALESDWASFHFATEGDNLFGMGRAATKEEKKNKGINRVPFTYGKPEESIAVWENTYNSNARATPPYKDHLKGTKNIDDLENRLHNLPDGRDYNTMDSSWDGNVDTRYFQMKYYEEHCDCSTKPKQ